jgi:hypothetical protein
MGDARDQNEPLGVVDGVDDPVIADANAVVVPSGELHAANRSRVACKRVDRIADAVAHRSLEPSELTCRRRGKPYLVRGFRPYSRTSAQGIALS